MLRELRVRRLALFEDESVAFGPGLNVITGATGSGKSLLLQALTLLLGGRFAREALRTGADSLEVEALFELTSAGLSAAVAEAAGAPDVERDKEIVVRRRVEESGRNRCETGGRLAAVGGLRTLGALLVELHGQSEHQRLTDRAAQVSWFDRWARLDDDRAAFVGLLAEWRATREELRVRTSHAAEHTARIEALRDVAETVAAAGLEEGEQDALRRERALLSDAERHARALATARALLEGDERGDERGALDALGGALRELGDVAELDAAVAGALQALEEAEARAVDAVRELQSAEDRIRVDPQRLEAVAERLSEIGAVLRRHGPTEADALRVAREAAEELAMLEAEGHDPVALTRRVSELSSRLLAHGRALNEARRAAAAGFAAAVVASLDELGMPGARFEVRIDDGDGDLEARAGPHGLGSLAFLVSPNAGEDLRELSRIASGGELARVALAVRGELAEADSVPVLVFDEIDADVGPRLGETIGRKLAQLARHRQVIVVTHLPQVAACAATHVRVRKETHGERTIARAETVTGDEREREIAEMLRGAERAEAALGQARDLLAEAGDPGGA